MVKACLTVRQTCQAETSVVGHSDPVIFNGKVSAYGK
jgi:hypothetical protein